MKRFLHRTALVLAIVVGIVALRALVGLWTGPALLRAAEARFEATFGTSGEALGSERTAGDRRTRISLREAVEALDLDEEGRVLIRAVWKDGPNELDSGDAAKLEALAEKNRVALDGLDRAVHGTARRPPGRAENVGESLLLDRGGVLGLAKLAGALGYRAVAERNDEELVLALDRLTTLDRALRQERNLVSLLLAQRIERTLLDLLRLRLESPAEVPILERSLAALDALDSAPGIRESLATEALYFARDGERESTTGWKDFGSLWTEDHWHAAGLEIFTELGRYLETPSEDWPEAEPGRPSKLSTFLALFNPWSTPAPLFGPLVQPMMIDAISEAQRTEAERGLGRLALSVARELAAGRIDVQALDGLTRSSRHEAWTGETPTIALLQDGFAHVALLRAEDLALEEGHEAAATEGHGIVGIAAGREKEARLLRWRVALPIRDSAAR